MTVYVRWYGNILQGELLDEEYLGMKQVRIPLDGHHPVALFTPGHVYESAELAANNSPGKSPNIPRSFPELPENFPELPENFQKSAEISKLDHLVSDDRETIDAFKRDNWDQEHNHLRIDKLDEFYQLWREAMRPFGFVEAEAVHESCTPSQQPKSHKPAAITKGYSEITSPYPAITQGYSETTQPYSKKTKKPQIIELSLFY
jgi:hypothetical protein